MPQGSTQVRDLKKITENFPAASSIIVVLEATEKNNSALAEQRVKNAVDILTEELKKPELSGYITRVQGKLDLDFFRSHGLMEKAALLALPIANSKLMGRDPAELCQSLPGAIRTVPQFVVKILSSSTRHELKIPDWTKPLCTAWAVGWNDPSKLS